MNKASLHKYSNSFDTIFCGQLRRTVLLITQKVIFICYKQLHWHDIVTIYLQICILYTCRNVSYCTRFWNIKTKTKTHIHKHFSRRKCKHVFAINHDRYYSTVNCQSLEFHILHIQNFLRGYNIDIKIRSVVLRCIIKVELLSLSHDMAEIDSH